MTRTLLRSLAVVSLVAFAVGCGGADDETDPTTIAIATGGSAGTGGGGAGAAGGTAGAAGGTAGTGGKAAAGGGATGGSAGAAGQAGSAGKAGTGGSAGAGGKGGAAGTGGTAGSAGGAGSAGSAGAGPALEDVHVSGRTLKVGSTHKFGWSGVSFTTRFSGTALSITLEDGGSVNDFEVVVDGMRHPERKIAVTAGKKSYTVIDGLTAGEHTATVHRRTEGSYGTTTFHGFTPTGGAIVPSPSPFAHRIEIVGDSITCGYGTECTSANEPFSSTTENHWLTYGAVTGRNLAADVHTIAWSGKGLVENYGTDTSATMPELYPHTFATPTTPAWEFGAWVADVVIINLGTNDWNHSPSVDPATFEAAYEAFASAIEAHYPKAHVFGIGNVLVGKAHTQAVKNAMSGKPNRHYVEFGLKSGEGVCCQHPCAATHARWGMELTDAIQAVTGW